MTTPEKMKAAVTWHKGNYFSAYTEGQRFEHHWGRTVNEADNALFNTLTLHFNPIYFNQPFAKEHGHDNTPINPLLVFNTVLGLSVEDLSEAGGPFLGIDDLTYGVSVYPGDTLTAVSTTTAVRESESRGGAGIVTWRTEGFNQRGEKVVAFTRSNLVRKSSTGSFK
ncbi:MaoC family dehydratase [Variovorax sp. PCZ-1]|uniref:MaoC family dehydratase n=1 Tax=Variovorax sp. PCZ-1 TaxID=2835533 RepID=UPI001BCCC312|nr:MaoC family dehydratase [Variovorax sp. PCZ-1]MBS7806072.1 MaoC family dehydratase [Variovorax sp. PCZ-1]